LSAAFDLDFFDLDFLVGKTVHQPKAAPPPQNLQTCGSNSKAADKSVRSTERIEDNPIAALANRHPG
jgi:hypothetical protein